MTLDALLIHGWAGVLLVAVSGLIVGSFLNVVIYRLPVMLRREWHPQAPDELEIDEYAGPAGTAPATFNLLMPRSHCRSCGHRIRIVENIPLLSWLALRGRCSNCGAAIAVRYPLVEAVTACATLAAVAAFGWSWPAVAAAGYACFLIALAGIDLDTQLLPDELTLPLLWAGLVTNALGGFTDLAAAVLGAAGGYLFLWGVYWIFKWLTGKDGMGYGDFKLFAAIGAWLGWMALPAVILGAAVAALTYALIAILRERRKRSQPIPFGPFLAMAGWAVLMFREQAGATLPI